MSRYKRPQKHLDVLSSIPTGRWVESPEISRLSLVKEVNPYLAMLRRAGLVLYGRSPTGGFRYQRPINTPTPDEAPLRGGNVK